MHPHRHFARIAAPRSLVTRLDGPPARFDMVVQSWDTANKVSQLSDFSVCTTWGIRGQRIYLLHVLRCTRLGRLYLMIPPTLRAVDPACQGRSLGELIAGFEGRRDDQYHRLCNGELAKVSSDQPFSKWQQQDEFEWLADCRAEQANLPENTGGGNPFVALMMLSEEPGRMLSSSGGNDESYSGRRRRPSARMVERSS
jgi:hypothetical protein